jgi:hypothetical protein
MKDRKFRNVPVETIGSKILIIRGKRVMLDRDLAQLYGVSTKVLNQAVKRNLGRFPDDFMFQLNDHEFKKWKSPCVTSISRALRSQIVTLKRGQHRKYLPYAFTEHGVAMLSSVLHSQRAIHINIQIMRAFVTMREFLATNKELAKMVKENRAAIIKIMHTIDELKQTEHRPRRRIGFHP